MNITDQEISIFLKTIKYAEDESILYSFLTTFFEDFKHKESTITSSIAHAKREWDL